MSPDVTILAALFAGLISFLSPCVLPLVPPYLVYLAGTSLERLTDEDPRTGSQRQTVAAAALFVAGFSTVFVTLGASASVFGCAAARLFLSALDGRRRRDHRDGAALPQRLQIPWLARTKRLDVAKPVGLWGAYAMGLAFAFGWTPCIGPILAAILAVAASEATVAKGAGLLAVYSLGLGIPFMLAAFAIEPFAKFLTRFRRHLVYVERAMGVLFILTGIAFLTGSITTFSFWLLEAFPALGRIG